MSFEAASPDESGAQFNSQNDTSGNNSKSALQGSYENYNYSGAEKIFPIPEDATSFERGEAQSETMKDTSTSGKSSNDASLELLQVFFREFLGITPKPSSDYTEEIKALRKRFFGLTKDISPETGSNNRFDYEQKYPRDPPGKEAAGNARVWLTYLDEAESFDRERVEGWKETVDVLLVFAGLFSGVITTFVSQASQSLQQDNTQVSAFLLFEVAQLLRAQFSGAPINIIPNSTLTPTSSFTPSPNARLVNGLWFTSLAITLSTALFAVLAKQWLYYYLTSITGTAHEKVRARQLRFKGFELWKVGAIVDLLPILLHLAVGVFLMGIIILLFPLDGRIAWTIVIITGMTYLLYFISVILPIRYPECPYTTSLTVYIGVLVFSLRAILRSISAALRKVSQVVDRRISFQALHYIQRLLQHTYNVFQHAFSSVFELAGIVHRGFGTLRDILFTEKFPKFTKWREENIKKAVKNAAFLDFEALDWLYATSPNRSVHRIIARCAAVHPIINRKFQSEIRENLCRTLEVSQTNIMDLRYGLCLDVLTTIEDKHWRLLQSIFDVEGSQLENAEYQSYCRIAKYVLDGNYRQIMKDAINDNLKLPLVMWRHFLKKVPRDVTVAAYILTYGQSGLFEWKSTCDTGVVSFHNKELGWWKFAYLYRYFFDDSTKPYSSLDKTFETGYFLLITIYRNLTSDQPLIADKEQREKSLFCLFGNFWVWVQSPNQNISPEDYFAFFRDILCADAFWSESMTNGPRLMAALRLDKIWNSMDTDVANRFHFTECHDLTPIYQWCSQDLDSGFLLYTTPIFTLLLMPQNRTRLCTILSNDPNAVSHFSKCFRNLGNCYNFHSARKYMYPNLMDIFKSVNPRVPLFTVLYNPSVLVQVWKFLVFQELDAKKFLLIVESKLDQEKLNDLYAVMAEQVRSSQVSDIHHALETSAHEFGQIIGVSHPRIESTAGKSTPESIADKDHHTEERAQVLPLHSANKSKDFHSAANWTTKVLGYVWPKTSVE